MTTNDRQWSARSTAIVGVCLVVLLGGVWWGFQAAEHRQSLRAHSSSYSLGNLKTIAVAQSLFREGDKEGDGTIDYGTMEELIATGLLSEGTPTSYGYRLETGPGSGAPKVTFWARATPGPDWEGLRSYFTNHEGLTWYSTTGEPAPITSLAAPPPGWRVVGQ